MNVHPFAERFPMLGEDQLRQLADDIVEHGQVYPIVTDGDGTLLDGRNRLAACALVGVTPNVSVWQGEDPVAYILSVNVHRRHITKSAQVMAVALAYPEAKHGGVREKGRKQVNSINLTESEKVLLSNARTIIREFGADSERVAFVMRGGSLVEVYQQAVEQKTLKEEWDRKLEAFKAQIAESGSAESLTVLGELTSPVDFHEAMEKMPSITKRLEMLDRQQRLLGTLQKFHEQIESIAEQPIVEGWMQEGFVASIYASVNASIQVLRQVAESYKATLSRPNIRKVK